MSLILKKLSIKTTLAVIVLAGLCAGFLVNLPVNAAGPQFNIFPITYTQPGAAAFLDYPLLDARRVGGAYSTSQSDHDNGVIVNPGEEIEFSIYYHNGVPDDPANTAIDTLIKAYESTTNLGPKLQTHFISATIEADNAAQVGSDNPVRGGSMRIDIAGSEPQSLSLVPGSTKHFKNWGSRDPQNGSPDISQTLNLPDTIFSNGVNIGDVRGCWPFYGFVSFRLKVSETPLTRDLAIQKQVRNITNNEQDFVDTTQAKENDVVEYQIVITTSGTGSQTGVTVSDTFNSRLQFESGEDIRGTGINLGTLNPNNTRTVIYRAKVTGSTSGTITNTAKVKSTEVSEKSDSASVNVSSITRNLTIQKKVRNLTNNESTFVETTNGKENDIVEYEVVIAATGNGAQTNVIANDALTTRLDFISGDDLRPTAGFNLGDMNPNDTRTLTYQAKVLGSTSGTITNTAKVKSDQVSQKQDTASVSAASITRNLTIQKKVRNLTKQETTFVDSTSASENDTVEYQVVITTTGTGFQSNVTVSDTFNSRLQFVSGDDLRGTGQNIGSLSQNETRTFTYTARVTGSTSGTITNTAKVKSTEVSEKSDSASVSVASTTRNLTIQKKVRNLTNNENTFADSTNAKENDIVEYQVVITATGNGAQTNVIATDVLTSRLEFVSGDDLRGSGQNLGDMNPNDTRTLTYRAKILGSTSGTITNTAKVKSTEVSEKSDSASVSVASTTRNLTIQKKVRNLTKQETSFVESTNAEENEIVEYQIVITASGNAGQTNLTITDVLHSRLEHVSGDNFNTPQNLGDIAQSETRTFTYQTKVLGTSATTITNTARVKSTEVAEKSDTATVKVLPVKAPGELAPRP